MSDSREPETGAGTDIDPEKVTGQDPRNTSGTAPIAADPEGNPDTSGAREADEG